MRTHLENRELKDLVALLFTATEVGIDIPVKEIWVHLQRRKLCHTDSLKTNAASEYRFHKDSVIQGASGVDWCLTLLLPVLVSTCKRVCVFSHNAWR